jgi:hypothetical protein
VLAWLKIEISHEFRAANKTIRITARNFYFRTI